MPTYAYQCRGEEHQFEGYTHSHQDPCPPCTVCGEETEKIWAITRHLGGVNWPFTTKHLSGKEETFNTPQELNRRLKELNIVRRDDSAYIEQEYQGLDFFTGKQRYKEGSGHGLPGCWF